MKKEDILTLLEGEELKEEMNVLTFKKPIIDIGRTTGLIDPNLLKDRKLLTAK